MPTFARELWSRIETIHAVIYFSPRTGEAAKALGLKGFWRGYFAFRAAPLGCCSPAVVEAAFFGFSPTMVRKAIPSIWDTATPEDCIEARAVAAASALRDTSVNVAVDDFVRTALRTACANGNPGARPLFAANRELPAPPDPVAELWQLCTTLREHRGDGHLAALTSAGLDAPQAAALFVADNDLPTSLLQEHRGWSDSEWVMATAALLAKGLLTDAAITDRGRAVRREIETITDRLADAPFADLDDTSRDRLLAALAPIASDITNSGLIPYPNPMGLPAFGRWL